MGINVGGTTYSSTTFTPTSGVLNVSGNLTIGTDLKASGQPWFNARGAASAWRYASDFGGVSGWRELGSPMGWTSNQQGAGSYGFSNSTGRYTAPVAGYYLFYMSDYYYNDANATSNYIHYLFGRNGTQAWVAGQTPYTIYSHGTVAYHTDGIVNSCIMYLNVGDYCCNFSYWGSGGSGRLYTDYHLFCGMLIG
jgi:hypothetical protein